MAMVPQGRTVALALWRRFPTCCIADFQSAEFQISRRLAKHPCLADWKSAIRQTGSLRYEAGATSKAPLDKMTNPGKLPPVIPPVIGSPRPPPLPPVVGRAAPRPSPPVIKASIKEPIARQTRKAKSPPALFTPEELERFKNLLVFARMVVEGYFSGKHKSPFHGSSAEFSEYKEYTAGDDPGNLDWRVYGRTRRLYLRQYEAETDMVVYLMLDTSGSMSYAGTGRQSKYLLAAKVAAALAYLMIHQGDKAALATFAEKVTQFQPPGGTRKHLHNLVSELEKVQPKLSTGMAAAVEECANLFRQRGLVVILSDFFTAYEPLFDALGHFMHRRFEILLLQVLDPDELNLPAMNVARFVDLESGEEVRAEPEEIRAAFRATMRERVEALAFQARQRRIRHAVIHTDRPYLEAIEAYLGFRGQQDFKA